MTFAASKKVLLHQKPFGRQPTKIIVASAFLQVSQPGKAMQKKTTMRELKIPMTFSNEIMKYNPYRIPHKPPYVDVEEDGTCSSCKQEVLLAKTIISEFQQAVMFWMRLGKAAYLFLGIVLGMWFAGGLLVYPFFMMLAGFLALLFATWYVYVGRTALKGLNQIAKLWFKNRKPSYFPISKISDEQGYEE